MVFEDQAETNRKEASKDANKEGRTIDDVKREMLISSRRRKYCKDLYSKFVLSVLELAETEILAESGLSIS